MKVLKTISEFRAWRRSFPQGLPAAFIPTMGALHQGHASLALQARKIADTNGPGVSIASIFVNPTQFGPTEDFAKYPRTLEADLALLQNSHCDAVFVPDAEEIYGQTQTPNATTSGNAITIDPGPLGTILEGAIRPGHFRGVCTVVAKLLLIIEPTHLLLGQKDFQQLAILRRMCMDLNFPVEVTACPTIREPDGLAMSSRNRYLSPDERTRAIALYEALIWAKAAFAAGERNAKSLEAGMKQRLQDRGLTPQYALPADALTLQPFNAQINAPAVLLIAAQLGKTRLIDNMPL